MKIGSYISLIFTALLAMSTVATHAQTSNSGADGNNGGYGQVYQSYGLAPATQTIQQNTQTQILRAIVQQAAETGSAESRPLRAAQIRISRSLRLPHRETTSK